MPASDEANAPPLSKALEEAAITSARESAPVRVRARASQSVVDVGCWTGGWLTVARELGVADILGMSRRPPIGAR